MSRHFSNIFILIFRRVFYTSTQLFNTLHTSNAIEEIKHIPYYGSSAISSRDMKWIGSHMDNLACIVSSLVLYLKIMLNERTTNLENNAITENYVMLFALSVSS